ncbi:adaptor-related protein complex 3 sigma 1 subunit, isoform CRA_a [Linderina pennispora]|uniref:AP complex subunit sigma n=1 Tax=Linderina pennispora TaxID=61395 RepID=A0A1Y1WL89_9FUNG|nr:adaptor-related protein complex 3 sigma 1 subunit, isoform CRA_a [Linderina pennispora]KAJ1956874.1 Sigma-adaptin 3A [Linderina pennispora]ORX74329.1 adaptor-related protein complex 3 sigma 1 subunit, isoform CRA_a [Linderina pennispora]
MIESVLIFNQLGKPRLIKTYKQLDTATQQQLLREIHSLVSKRSDTLCNFLHGSQQLVGSSSRIVYRHYATLYFVFIVDSSESELGILDLIQVFVEALDRVFENVCELDLIFHFDDVHYILSEVVSAGMVVETNLAEISKAVNEGRRQKKPLPEPSRVGIGALRRGFV